MSPTELAAQLVAECNTFKWWPELRMFVEVDGQGYQLDIKQVEKAKTAADVAAERNRRHALRRASMTAQELVEDEKDFLMLRGAYAPTDA